MVVFTKLTINGIEYNPDEMCLERNTGDFNSISNFTIKFNNYAGRYDDTFALNDEVVIYANLDTNPAITKLFTGVIEDLSYSGSELNEELTLTGRDYGAVLMDMTVQPIVFKERDAGEIAKVIVEQNSYGIVTSDNIDTTTGAILDMKSFNHKNIFDALKELAELAEYYFYIDENKDVHFEARSGTSSGKTFDNSNILEADFKTSDSEVYNKVWVYGARQLAGVTDSFTSAGSEALTGSVFTLDSKPHNTRVYVDSVLQEVGGVYQMDNPATTSGLKWVVDFNQKHLIFVSGTAAGDNRPASGAQIQVDYDRTSPLLKFVQDGDSISTYGPKTKVIIDRNIKDYASCTDKANTFLAENKEPKIQGDIDVYGIVDVTPGNTCVVNIPFHNIDNQTYDILSCSYNFSKENCLANKVLHLTLNKKISDFTDIMKDQMLRMRTIETGEIEGNLTRLETANYPIDTQYHYEIWQGNVNDNFVFHSDKHGRLEDTNSRIGVGLLGSSFLKSGGDY
jgi:prophage tail gpP-like protein